MKIEERGFTNLVNKFIREKVNKQESKWPNDQFAANDELPPLPDYDTGSDDGFQLLLKDELQERAVVRALVEFGLKTWSDSQKVADHIFEELVDEDLFDNKQLLDVIQTYKTWYEAGIEPTAKNFYYHENQELSAVVVSLMEFPYELSEKWKDKFQMAVSQREDMYREEVISTLGYLKLRKIKRLIDENQQDLSRPHSIEEQMTLLQTHQALKQMERDLLQNLGTVIVR